MKRRRRFGYVVAGPAEYAIHWRRGRTRRSGRGISLFCWPFIDRCYLIPSAAQSITFAADQITAENQGVEADRLACDYRHSGINESRTVSRRHALPERRKLVPHWKADTSRSGARQATPAATAITITSQFFPWVSPIAFAPTVSS